jgi:DNA helicase IV
MLELPDYDALGEEQDDVLALPLDSSSIITGPPGTGKTVMAIYRARMLHKSGRKTLLLMFGKLLSQYTSAAVAKLEVDGVVNTYHNWFPRFWRQCYGQEPPHVDRWTFDWSACKEVLFTQPPPDVERRHVLIDEGQDMPKDFYLVMQMASASMTVFADENQRITQRQSTIAEIRAASGIERQLSLTRNYRNTRPIAELAATFYVGLSSGIPDMPPPSARGEKPSLVRQETLEDAARLLVNYERTHSDQTIGVLLPYADQVRVFYRLLNGKTRRPVQVYLNDDPRKKPIWAPINFAEPGLKLLTHASSKGLEFDSVFLPELQSLRGDVASDDMRMRFYVLSSRAKRQLTFMYTGQGTPQLVAGLPLQLLEDRRL